MEKDEPLRCASCGEPIGTYEPIVVSEDGSTRISSLAREPLLGRASATLLHKSCAAGGTS